MPRMRTAREEVHPGEVVALEEQGLAQHSSKDRIMQYLSEVNAQPVVFRWRWALDSPVEV